MRLSNLSSKLGQCDALETTSGTVAGILEPAEEARLKGCLQEEQVLQSGGGSEVGD